MGVGRDQAPPRRNADILGGVQGLRIAGYQAVRGENLLR